jgi:hypothetical protein
MPTVSIPQSAWALHLSARFLLAPKVNFARVDNGQQDTAERRGPVAAPFHAVRVYPLGSP